jgi:hypothetical protein
LEIDKSQAREEQAIGSGQRKAEGRRREAPGI